MMKSLVMWGDFFFAGVERAMSQFNPRWRFLFDVVSCFDSVPLSG